LPRGQATLDLNTGHVFANIANLPQNGTFDLWFVKNVEGPGKSVLPESGDQFFKVGSFEGRGAFRSLDVSIGINVNFDLDMIVVTRGGKDPSQSRIATGDRTLFEKRLFRFRASRGLDPVTGTLANNIESTDPLVARGAQIFFNETFGGNGRTCGTCHRADDNLTIDPAFIARLPPTDPLFVAETNPALAKLENPTLLRTRGLILENVDGFEDPTRKFVMRGVPHTLSLAITNGIENAFGGPPDHRLGWGGDGGPGRSTLHEFSFGAIVQHFTKNLRRRPGVDFRIPTQEELDALEAFQLFTGRQKQRDFFQRFPADPKASNGRDLFFNSNCTFCHNDFFEFNTFNSNFDTDVANLTPELPLDDGFLKTGEFNVPPLAEAADTPPLFHNNSAATIEDAVAFYGSQTFINSPNGFFAVFFTPEEQANVGAFLRVVNASTNIDQVRKRVEFIERVRSAGNTDLLSIAIADTRDARVVLSDKGLSTDVVKSLRRAQTVLENARRDADNRRPNQMARVLTLLDQAQEDLFTAEPPPGGSGGTGGIGGRGGTSGTGGIGAEGGVGEGGFGEGGTGVAGTGMVPDGGAIGGAFPIGGTSMGAFGGGAGAGGRGGGSGGRGG
jgi:hypothetical protein